MGPIGHVHYYFMSTCKFLTCTHKLCVFFDMYMKTLCGKEHIKFTCTFICGQVLLMSTITNSAK